MEADELTRPNPLETGARVYRIPRVPTVDRLDYLVANAAGKSVIEVGFIDRMTLKLPHGTWPHARAAEVAREIRGVDLDPAGVELARGHGFEGYVADCQSADELVALRLERAELVMAGEVLEHLDRPGDFLEAVKVLLRPDGRLLLTTPNAMSLTNAVGALLWREAVNPDHVAFYSWRTLTTLLARHGWEMEEFRFAIGHSAPAHPRAGLGARAVVRLQDVYLRSARALAKAWPPLAEGMAIRARLR